jgi:hypothetical protein
MNPARHQYYGIWPGELAYGPPPMTPEAYYGWADPTYKGPSQPTSTPVAAPGPTPVPTPTSATARMPQVSDGYGEVPARQEGRERRGIASGNDAAGHTTIGLGVSFTGGALGGGGQVSFIPVVDREGNLALAISVGAGAFAGFGGSAAGTLEVTNAPNIKRLAGVSVRRGLSLGTGLLGGRNGL